MEDNPIADKRLYKLILQCRTKQICDYVKQHGTDAPKVDSKAEAAAKASNVSGNKSRKQKQAASEEPANLIVVHRHTDDSVKLVYMEQVKDVRPFVLCCIVKTVDLSGTNFKKFLQIQTKLHETVCGKRELSTIATHDLAKIKGSFIRYTAHDSRALEIIPLGKTKRMSAQKLYDQLKGEAEALRKEKKRNIYSGIHKYLYLLDKKTIFACLEDSDGNVISMPPLTNGDLTKVGCSFKIFYFLVDNSIYNFFLQISPETQNVLIEVTSSASLNDCRLTIQELLKEMLLAGFGVLPTPANVDEESSVKQQLLVQQVKTTDLEGNLRAVYPSKQDLQFDENLSILVERE